MNDFSPSTLCTIYLLIFNNISFGKIILILRTFISCLKNKKGKENKNNTRVIEVDVYANQSKQEICSHNIGNATDFDI